MTMVTVGTVVEVLQDRSMESVEAIVRIPGQGISPWSLYTPWY